MAYAGGIPGTHTAHRSPLYCSVKCLEGLRVPTLRCECLAGVDDRLLQGRHAGAPKPLKQNLAKFSLALFIGHSCRNSCSVLFLNSDRSYFFIHKTQTRHTNSHAHTFTDFTLYYDKLGPKPPTPTRRRSLSQCGVLALEAVKARAD